MRFNEELWSWVDDGDEYDTDASDDSRLLPPHPEDWQDCYSELLVEIYHMLRDEGHLTGVLDRCSLNDLAYACYSWSTGIGVPVLQSTKSPLTDVPLKNYTWGLWKTLESYRDAEPEFLRFLDKDSFLVFCDRVSSSRLLDDQPMVC
jgi:hypothetical protein